MTAQQRRVYDAIAAFKAEHDCAPVLRELGAILGISSSTGVHGHLKRLERKGWVELSSGKVRRIRLLEHLDTSPAGLLRRAQSIVDSWSPLGEARLSAAEDASWWVLRLNTGGDQANETTLRAVEQQFRARCWQLSRRGGEHVYAWGPVPLCEGLMATDTQERPR